jgi:hypothetical protein
MTMGEVYKQLLSWATQNGVELTGVEPQALASTGIGMFATRPIQVKQALTRPLNMADHADRGEKIFSYSPLGLSVH